MPNIFGRTIPVAHAGVDDDLKDLENDTDGARRAFAENLRLDDRVSGSVSPLAPKRDPRSTRFLRRWRFLRRRRSDVLISVLAGSRRTSAREFSDPLMNDSNIVFSPNLGRSDVDGGTRVVTIQLLGDGVMEKLADLLGAIRSADERGEALGRSNPVPVTQGWVPFVDDWLDRHTAEEEPDVEMRRLLAGAIEGAYPPSDVFPWDRVVWVGRADEFQPHKSLGARRWLEIFGLGHFLFDSRVWGHWFVALEYPVADTALAARPCVLEAGANEWHFPTPASRPAQQGGKTVVLGEARTAGMSPMTEFVHLNRRVDPRDIVAVSRYVSGALVAKEVELEAARNRHRATVF